MNRRCLVLFNHFFQRNIVTGYLSYRLRASVLLFIKNINREYVHGLSDF